MGAGSSCASAAAALSSGSPREVGQPSGSPLLGPRVLGAECGVFQHVPFSGEVSSKF